MKTNFPIKNLKISLLILGLFNIFALIYCENFNHEKNMINSTNNLNSFEKEVLQNKFEELLNFKKKYITGNKKCNYLIYNFYNIFF